MEVDAPSGSREKSDARTKSAERIFNQFQFAEMNLRHRGNPARTLDLVRRAVRMGYDSVVINIDIGEFKSGVSLMDPQRNTGDAAPPPRKKQKKKRGRANEEGGEDVDGGGRVVAADFIPDPFQVDPARLDLSSLETAGKRFRQFSRLTASITDTTSFHKFQQHPKLRLYDVIAIRIDDEQFLSTLHRKGEFVDIISIESTHADRVQWLYKQKLVQACAGEGLSFELVYSGALTSVENRRQFFTNGRSLMEITRGGRGVILSSGADDIISMRAPYDVMNLCTLFGVNHRDGRKFVAENARSVLLRAQARKTIKGTVHVAPDLHTIPSATGAPSAEVLDELSKIPEFRKQLLQVSDEKEAKADGDSTPIVAVADQ